MYSCTRKQHLMVPVCEMVTDTEIVIVTSWCWRWRWRLTKRKEIFRLEYLKRWQQLNRWWWRCCDFTMLSTTAPLFGHCECCKPFLCEWHLQTGTDLNSQNVYHYGKCAEQHNLTIKPIRNPYRIRMYTFLKCAETSLLLHRMEMYALECLSAWLCVCVYLRHHTLCTKS